MERDPSNATDRRVRVFISSTFRDMHAERDHLVAVVFPELRERCERLGLEFFDVDLRWGVPEKDANGETANSWEYCKKWIDRVEPFFVSILGQRYGYIPKPQDIRDENDRRKFADLSITEMEIRHAVMAGKLRRRSFFYLRKERVPENAPVEIRNVFVEDDKKVERLKGEIKAGWRPVYEYLCEWTGSGFAKLEDFGKHVLEDLWSGVLRDERYVSNELWRKALGAEPDADSRYTDESNPVPPDLAEKLLALAKPTPVSPLDAEREQMERFAESRLRWFQGRTKERRELLRFTFAKADDSSRLAAVIAVPGQGKSALISKLHQTMRRVEKAGRRSIFLVTHFVGATDRSASSHALVQRLLDELDHSGIQWSAEERKEGEEPKRDYNSLCNRLANRLRDYSGERRIVILLDALNQLSDGHGLVWLPHRLGSQLRVVISCVENPRNSGRKSAPSSSHDGQSRLTSAATPKQQVLGALERWQDSSLRVPLGPLSEADVREIVVNYLEEYCKELDERHVAALCQVPQASNPLYLLVMLGELRTLGGDDMNRHVPQLIAELPMRHPDTVSLFRWVLQRLEVFGAEAVKWWCLYLAHGRAGIASQELADLLARKLGENAASSAHLIERGLRRYLQRRGAQLDFFHSQLRQAVFDQYGEPASREVAKPISQTTQIHRNIADYFVSCAKGDNPQREWETHSVRGFAECVFHLVKAGQHEQAAGLLSNFPFLLHKLRAGLLEGVFEDYNMIWCEAPAEAVKRLAIWADFFREKAHILRRGNEEWPAYKILLQLAVEHADNSPLTTGAEQWLAESRCNWLWFRQATRLPQAQKNPCQAVLEGHSGTIRGALVLSDGRLLSWGFDENLRVWDTRTGACAMILEGHFGGIGGALALSDSRILSWSGDRTLRLWDVRSGACLKVLEGHTSHVAGAFALGEAGILSWSGDRTLRLWDVRSGACLTVLEGQPSEVSGALALSEGRLLSCGETLRLWHAETGAFVTVLGGHSGWVGGALALSGDRVLSWSADKTLRLWDVQKCVCLNVLKGHANSVNGALVLDEGRLVSWSDDGTLLVWDQQSGGCLAMLVGHSDKIGGALALEDGRILSWSCDNTLRLWDKQDGACLKVLEGHANYVIGALALEDGRILSWSLDRTLRLWDGHSGVCLMVLQGHSAAVFGALVLSTKQLLSWSGDKTLRLWDGRRRTSVSMEGHTLNIKGVLELANDCILSWSQDATLRLWNRLSGAHIKKCGVFFEGQW